MIHRHLFIASAVIASAALAGVANAEFAPGMPVEVNGAAGGSTNPLIQNTTWGTWAGQGVHLLGGQSDYWDNRYGAQSPLTLPVFVTSFVVNPHSVVFHIDFSQFVPSDYTAYSVDILHLKQDGSIVGASGNFGSFTTDGNDIHWTGSGADLIANGKVLEFKIFQVPAPGALALMGLAGIVGGRRRRN